MAPNYLQVPEPGYEGSFAATSAGGDSNEIVASPHHSNRRSWPGTTAHTGNRLSVFSHNPETGGQLSAFGSIATNRASIVSWDRATYPLSFEHSDSAIAARAPLSGADLPRALSELDTHGGGESPESGSSYDNPEGLSPDLNLLVNESLLKLEQLSPHQQWNPARRNMFRGILTSKRRESMPEYILERLGLRHGNIVNVYEGRLESVQEVTWEEAFHVGTAGPYLESLEQVLSTYCRLDADTMINATYQVSLQVEEWLGPEEEQGSCTGEGQMQSTGDL
jgi:hypothetical protein